MEPSLIRSIPQAAKYYRALDPESCVSENFLRGLVRRGLIPTFKLGPRKVLISIASVEEYLKLHARLLVNDP